MAGKTFFLPVLFALMILMLSGMSALSLKLADKHYSLHAEDIGIQQQGKTCIQLPISCDVQSCQKSICNKNKVKGIASCMLNNLCCCSPRN
ncbi:hypothetical protein BVRB_4g089660 [Beta vulgaris subsp. vulgaris]|nr:hypothetical protein BVRB_4g089660 [Beta vulgaris subsp. vulgaris]